MPKEMLPIVDKPIIQRVVEELVEAGIEDIVIVTGYHKRTIEDHFDNPGHDLVKNLLDGNKHHLLEQIRKVSNLANFVYVRQKGPYGNGTPLVNVRHLIGDEPFIYTWSDDFVEAEPVSRFKQLIATYHEHSSSVLGCIRAKSDEDYKRYAFVGGEKLSPDLISVNDIIEKPGKDNAPSNLGSVSGFLFTPDIFNYLDQVMNSLNSRQEFYYVDALRLMLADGHKILAKEIENGRYYDTGNKLEYLKTVVEFGLKHPEIGSDFKSWLEKLNE